MLQSKAKVLLIATHADEVDCTLDGEGLIYHVGAARLLQDFQRIFKYKLDIQPELYVLCADSPNTPEIKFLKQQLIKQRDQITTEIPTGYRISEAISSHLDTWNKAQKPPIMFWPDFIRLVQTQINPLCSEAVLREVVQFLQYTGDIIVLETGDENDLIILNPSWLLVEVVGNLFSQDGARHARVTGSFTADDLHFLLTEGDVNMVVNVLVALECCTVCPMLESKVNDVISHYRRRSIHSFFEDAIAGATMEAPHIEDYQLEIPRLNLVQAFEAIEWKDLGEDVVWTGIQLQGLETQIVHVFPRIQCRLRRTESRISAELQTAELIQWLYGSKLTFNYGQINVYITFEDSESAIEVKVQTPRGLAVVAFRCFSDTVFLVRAALDEIVPQLTVSNHLLMFSRGCSEDGNIHKDIVSQPVLFKRLAEESESQGGTSPFLEKTLFLHDFRLMQGCWYGPLIPASWIRYEVFLDVCCILGRNDGLTGRQLNDLARKLIGLAVDLGEGSEDDYPTRLQRLLRVLVKWHLSRKEDPIGHLIAAFESVGLMEIATYIQTTTPLFLLKETCLHVCESNL